MPNSYTEITRYSWVELFKYSFKATLIGILLFLSAFLMLFLNEGRTINRAQTLEEGEKIVTVVKANQLKDINEGKLIYVSGEASANEELIDEEFDVSAANVIKLRRVVEMYQWQEREESETEILWGGSSETRTIYTYSKVWSNTIIDSHRFKQPDGHKNPSYMWLKGKILNAKVVQLGKFTLSPSLIAKMNNYQQRPITTPKTFEQMPSSIRSELKIRDEETFRKKFHLHHGNYYVGRNTNFPEIGDLRIRFEIVFPAIVSVIAKQEGSKLVPYTTEEGGKIELFGYSSVDATTLFKRAKLFQSRFTWILRFIGFAIMFFGLLLIFNVLKVLVAFIPWLSSLVEWTGWFVAFILSATFSLVTIAIAWLSYRQTVGMIVLIMAIVPLLLLRFARRQEMSILVSETQVPMKIEQ